MESEVRHAAFLMPLLVLTLDLLGFLYLLVQERSFLAKIILATGLLSLGLAVLNLGTADHATLVGAMGVHAAFLLLIIVMMLGQLSRVRIVSLDMVMAGVIAYLVMADFWNQIYVILILLSPKSIDIAGGLGPHPYTTLYYFSVTTLTTAGFGDVVPVSDLARVLVSYEALVGQVYLAVFIALLMGRHFANR